VNCKEVTLIFRTKATREELEKALAQLVRIDLVNFRVIEGPTERRNGEGFFTSTPSSHPWTRVFTVN
jgi:hypothetical protein